MGTCTCTMMKGRRGEMREASRPKASSHRTRARHLLRRPSKLCVMHGGVGVRGAETNICSRNARGDRAWPRKTDDACLLLLVCLPPRLLLFIALTVYPHTTHTQHTHTHTHTHTHRCTLQILPNCSSVGVLPAFLFSLRFASLANSITKGPCNAIVYLHATLSN